MAVFAEILILYIILFFSRQTGVFTGAEAAEASFSAKAELARTFLYSIPSLALIFYLVFKSWKLDYWVIRPGKKDIKACLTALPCLLITGFTIAAVSSFAEGETAQTLINSPATAAGWAVLAFSLICSAYLEEGFFRFYLLSQRDKMNLNAPSALAISTALFAACHIYEGPWGFLNSVLSGIILGFVFLRYQSLHGTAIAHALYNTGIYIINSLWKN